MAPKSILQLNFLENNDCNASVKWDVSKHLKIVIVISFIYFDVRPVNFNICNFDPGHRCLHISEFIQGNSIFRIETGICILATWDEVIMKKRKYLIFKTNLTCDFPELKKVTTWRYTVFQYYLESKLSKIWWNTKKKMYTCM